MLHSLSYRGHDWRDVIHISWLVGILAYFSMDWIQHHVWLFVSHKTKRYKKDLGRRICLLMLLPLFLLFLGICQRENLQLEEFVFYFLLFLQTGIIIRVCVHFLIAKIFGPFIWGRGFCGWACWTGAILEWLPIKENKKIPVNLTRYRYISLIISLGIPITLILLGYDWINMHINEQRHNMFLNYGKPGSLIWFIVSNIIYYVLAIWLAFKFRKNVRFAK